MVIRTLTHRAAPLWLAVLLLAVAGCEKTAPGHVTVTLAGRTFDLELAADDAARYQGLSDREVIPEDGGMLFAFPNARPRTFVMRRCLVPIDIIFVGDNGRIVAMHAMQVEPYDTPNPALKPYPSRYPASVAIELKGGTLEELDLSVGDKLDLPMADLKAAAQ